MVPLEEPFFPFTSLHIRILKAYLLKFNPQQEIQPFWMDIPYMGPLSPDSKVLSSWEIYHQKINGSANSLSSLKVVFDTSYLISKEYLPGALKAYTSTPYLPLLVKITLLLLINHLLMLFAKGMLTNISKAELAEMAKKMRAVANMPKDSLTQKEISSHHYSSPN